MCAYVQNIANIALIRGAAALGGIGMFLFLSAYVQNIANVALIRGAAALGGIGMFFVCVHMYKILQILSGFEEPLPWGA